MKKISEIAIEIASRIDNRQPDLFEKAFVMGAKYFQRWIPIEEELPETNEFYESKICLVKNTYGNVDVARYYSNTKSWYFNSSDFVVTHWRAIEFN